MTLSRPSSRPFLLVGLVWLIIAVMLGASGQLSLLRPPFPGVVIAALTGAILAAAAAFGSFRLWLFSLGYRQLIAFHLTRFVGAYFLVLYGRGELPFAFAVPGGWGDIAIATLALGFVLLVPRLEARAGLVAGWNLLGLADIAFVVVTAARLGMADPASMEALLRLPLSLLPTFLVPVIIASHLIIFWRLWVERP